jgi:hypothetical protein
MPMTEKRVSLVSVGLLSLWALTMWTAGCVSSPPSDFADRQAEVEARITEAGLTNNARVQAARSELEAAVAREDEKVLLDSVELRAAAVTAEDTKMDALVRLPIGNPLAISALQEARRANSRVALAELSEAMLKSRVELCLPSLQREAEVENREIFSEFEKQHRALIDWNEDLRRAGSVDEVQWSRFKLETNVRLSRREISETQYPLSLYGLKRALNVLPSLEGGLTLLDDDIGNLRERLKNHQPEIEAHRAKQQHYEAMARGESAKRLPSVRFVDFGFEPIPDAGEERQYAARVAFEIPFGREAGAKKRRYDALARAEVSDQRRVLDERVREARTAIEEINVFRGRAEDWRALLAMAEASEQVAARWWRERRADPGEIAKLLDTVYSARMTVLKARARAGAAGCTLLSATGVLVTEW